MLTSISMSDSVSLLHSAPLWPGLKPPSLSDSTLSRLHSEADLSLAMAALSLLQDRLRDSFSFTGYK